MYDVAILGGGISGLYLAYNLLKRDSKKKVVIIEKSRELGGRVDTYQDKWMSVEAGAGRIHNGHTLTLNLIQELGLYKKLVEINNNIRFVMEEDENPDSRREVLIFDSSPRSGDDCGAVAGFRRNAGVSPTKEEMRRSFGHLVDPPHIDIMKRVSTASKKMSKESLIGKSLLEVSMEVVGEDAAKAALASFGYTTEFLKMNAYDAIALMGIIAKPQKYFVLGGGLSQVIERLKARLLSMGCQFETGREVVRINKGEGELYTIFCDNGGSIQSSRCVCTFPVEDVLRLRVYGLGEFNEWKRVIKASVYGGSLCRIYSVFPQSGSESKGSWFAGLGKMTMKNDVRMIIPVDEEKGVVMISYTDGAIANRWARMESDKGIREVNRRLKELIDARLNISIPMPKHTRIFYWSNGVGYWKVGADSAAVEKRATNGFHGLYFCGENYSAKNQQWVEGALDTAEMVCRKI